MTSIAMGRRGGCATSPSPAADPPASGRRPQEASAAATHLAQLDAALQRVCGKDVLEAVVGHVAVLVVLVVVLRGLCRCRAAPTGGIGRRRPQLYAARNVPEHARTGGHGGGGGGGEGRAAQRQRGCVCCRASEATRRVRCSHGDAAARHVRLGGRRQVGGGERGGGGGGGEQEKGREEGRQKVKKRKSRELFF